MQVNDLKSARNSAAKCNKQLIFETGRFLSCSFIILSLLFPNISSYPIISQIHSLSQSDSHIRGECLLNCKMFNVGLFLFGLVHIQLFLEIMAWL